MRLLILLLITLTCSPAKTYKSASELDYPPYSIVKENKADGFSVELLRAALQAMNHDVSYYVAPWPKIKKDLELGKIDVLPLVGRTPERESIFDFSIPYLKMRGAIVVREKNSDIQSFEDLQKKEVLVMQEDNTHEFLLRKGGSYKISTKESFEEALRDLASGRADAVFVQKLVAIQLIKKLRLENLKIVPTNIKDFSQDFSFAVKEGDKELLALLNEGLSIIMANGTYQNLHQKWLAPLHEADKKSEELVKTLGLIILFLSIFIVIAIVWQISLKRQVEKKTKELNKSQKELQELNDSLQAKIEEALEELSTKDKLMLTQSRQAAMGEMISIIAHQWRQPLSIISMAVNNLSLDAELEERVEIEKLKKTTKTVQEQVSHLSSTIDDFRDFFKPNKKKQSISISKLTESALHIVGPSLQDHNIEFEKHIEEDVDLFIYRNEMIQVLINLINNAKDALQDKESPKIIFSSKVTKESVSFFIEDNGGGISKKVLEKLGEPYVSTKSLSGTGLGVYISKMILQKHFDGSLTWKNKDAGACFTITIAR